LPPLDAVQTLPVGETGGADAPAPNLRVRLEGNRRWCARSIEQIWPARPTPRGRWPRGRRRTPIVSTLAYAYYIVAHPQQKGGAGPPPAQAGPAPAREQVSASDSPLADMRAEGQAIEEEYLREAEPEEVAANAAPVEMEREAAGETPAGEIGGGESAGNEAEGGDIGATQAAGAPSTSPGIDVQLALRPGSIVFARSPVYHTMTRRRVNRPGQPLKVQAGWDSSRSCCNLPTFIDAALPPGRYVLQAHFEVLFAGRGWQPVQVARLEGVEVREGEITEVRLRVDSQGYVAVNPAGRVVEFPDASPPQPTPPSDAPAPAAGAAPAPVVPSAPAPPAGPTRDPATTPAVPAPPAPPGR
jgi:hypothetical protein